ncbi:hypothetical protein FQN49_001474 [Arthroderma sp. PD_2]|nr:hypothetical protein FQN49_001474 [Arthroderma sp. PD_2]
MKGSGLVVALFIGTAAAGIHGTKPNGPKYQGTNPECTWFFDVVEKDTTCESIEKQWDLSHEVFVAWNPGAKKDCGGLPVGLSVCVEAPKRTTTSESSTSETSTSLETSTESPTSTGPPVPSPTQADLVASCTKFYLGVSGDTCARVLRRHKPLTMDQFVEWNPAVGKDCSGLWADYYYCVAAPTGGSNTTMSNTNSTVPSKTMSNSTIQNATATSANGIDPNKIQPDIASNCVRWHKVVKGNTCSSIVSQYGTFTQEEFVKWNPAVEKDCSGLWLNYYYCIAIPGTPTVKPTTSKATPTGCASPGLPSPTQPGAICKCKKWHQVVQGNTCEVIVRKYKISIDKFNKWNPEVGGDCHNLWLRYHVCVGAA